MRRFNSILSIVAVAAAFLILPAQASAHFYHSAQWYDDQTNIVERWETERLTVEDQVMDNQSDNETGEVNEKAVVANIAHIERLVARVKDTKTCAAQ